MKKILNKHKNNKNILKTQHTTIKQNIKKQKELNKTHNKYQHNDKNI